MRIPIPIFSQRKSRVLEVPGRCAACGADRGFDVAQLQVRVWLAFLPMAGRSLQREGRCKACGAAAPENVLAKARVPVVFAFGWLFFLVLPLVGLGAYSWIDSAIRHAKYERERKQEEESRVRREAAEKDRQDAQQACEDAFKKADAAKDACFKSMDDFEATLSKDFAKEKPRAPSDVSMITHAAVAGVGRPLVPDSPYFGDTPCPIDVPYSFEISTTCYKLYTDGMSVEPVRAKTKETLAAVDALKAPDRWATVIFKCNDWSCIQTALWVDRPTKTILALARVTKPKTADEDANKKALQKALGDQLAKWK